MSSDKASFQNRTSEFESKNERFNLAHKELRAASVFRLSRLRDRIKELEEENRALKKELMNLRT